MIRAISYLCLAVTLAAANTNAVAANAPSQLHNKTIAVSFSLSAPAGPGGGPMAPLAVQRLIYVSSKGQIFVRGSRSTGAASDSKDVSVGTYRYDGGRIIGYYTMANHANQISITFDSGFRTCNASIQFGKAAGQSYKLTAPNGVTIVSNSPPTISGLSCSIRDGNPFGE